MRQINCLWKQKENEEGAWIVLGSIAKDSL